MSPSLVDFYKNTLKWVYPLWVSLVGEHHRYHYYMIGVEKPIEPTNLVGSRVGVNKKTQGFSQYKICESSGDEVKQKYYEDLFEKLLGMGYILINTEREAENFLSNYGPLSCIEDLFCFTNRDEPPVLTDEYIRTLLGPGNYLLTEMTVNERVRKKRIRKEMEQSLTIEEKRVLQRFAL